LIDFCNTSIYAVLVPVCSSDIAFLRLYLYD
jgi:hypothetical protein